MLERSGNKKEKKTNLYWLSCPPYKYITIWSCFFPYNYHVEQIKLSPFYRWENWDSEILGDPSEHTEQLNTGARIWSQADLTLRITEGCWYYAMLCLVAQPCLTLCNPMVCSLPGSFVHGDSPGKNIGKTIWEALEVA